MPTSLLTRLIPRYRIVAYAAVFTSGAVALVFQVVWQRYLAFLVGSEARSISLVVAVFLLGLAAGYRFWGNATQRDVSRRDLLKLTGYIELAIGAYAAAFPLLFNLVRSRLVVIPDWLMFDFVITVLLLFLPTFLMGASIPLLTAALPDFYGEVNYTHSRIYGINTLGAFFGAFAGGLVLVPTLGLRGTLFLGVLFNIMVALVFIANSVPGRPQQAEEVPVVSNRFGTGGILAFVFITGAVSIAFEVLMMRVLSLAVGSGQYVFPVVVGVVILGLGIGSLSLRREGMRGSRVVVEVFATAVLLMLVVLSVPYWGYWISHIRVSLTSIPSNYDVFIVAVAVFVALFLLPVYVLFGRMLPVGYSLVQKDRSDYGKVCGRVYYFNTLGTVFGSVILGHLLLEFMGLEALVRLNIAVLVALAMFLAVREKGLRWALAAGLPLALVLAVLPGWHMHRAVPNLFRNRTVKPYHFQGLFVAPRYPDDTPVLFARDDANLSVVVMEYPSEIIGPDGRPVWSRSIAVNHKTDGNTLYDYSNMVLTGVIPYLYAPDRPDLAALVVGLGTGLTSGVLCQGEQVSRVVTVEISPSVIEALPFFDQHTFSLSADPKSTLVQADAFRFLARGGEHFDLVISEPSNPWIAGIENLFTPEYYTLVRRRLAEDGVFFQWVQTYETSPVVLAGVIRNFIDHFPHARLFSISGGDIGLLGSVRPLSRSVLDRRLSEDAIRTALNPVGVSDPPTLELLAHLDTAALKSVAFSLPRARHEMEYPWLGRMADRARFVGKDVGFLGALPDFVVREPAVDPYRQQAFRRAVEEFGHRRADVCRPYVVEHSNGLLCNWLGRLASAGRRVSQPPESLADVPDWLDSWGLLRDRGLVRPDPAALRRVERILREHMAGSATRELRAGLAGLLAELAAEAQWEWAEELLVDFRGAGVLSESDLQRLAGQLLERRFLIEAVRVRQQR